MCCWSLFKMFFNSFFCTCFLLALPCLLVRGGCFHFDLCNCASRSEGMSLLLETMDGDDVIPDFLERLGFLTSPFCVLQPKFTVTVVPGDCYCWWCSLFWSLGSSFKHPEPRLWSVFSFGFARKLFCLARGALIFSACWSWWLPSCSHGGVL